MDKISRNHEIREVIVFEESIYFLQEVGIYHCCRPQTDTMIALRFVLLLAFGAAVGTAEESAPRPPREEELKEEPVKRNIDMEGKHSPVFVMVYGWTGCVCL